MCQRKHLDVFEEKPDVVYSNLILQNFADIKSQTNIFINSITYEIHFDGNTYLSVENFE